MRHVVLHHHILKNAGTSMDAALRASFGAAWHAHDPVDTLGHDAAATHALPYLTEHPELRALSSHVFRPADDPVPGVTIYPIVFLRDPIVRAASIYWFLRRTPHNDASHWLARTFDFREFVEIDIVAAKRSHIRNHQTRVLSGYTTCCPAHAWSPTPVELFEKALAYLQALPAFGIVERFDESLEWLASWLRPVFPEIVWAPVHLHDGEHGITSREAVRRALGPNTYAKLLALNRYDIELYDEAVRRFERSIAGPSARIMQPSW